jgi:hypothetical protein
VAGRPDRGYVSVLELRRRAMMIAVGILLLVVAALAGYAWYMGDEK